MEPRKQFTFYRSYFDAIQKMCKRDQGAVLMAICSYAIYGAEPAGLSAAASTAFTLIRPTLDSGRKKAASGKQGGSKPKAKRKQTAREKEYEGEYEKEYEYEYECIGDSQESKFQAFFSRYPKKSIPEVAWAEWQKLNPDDGLADKIMDSLEVWKASPQWLEGGGRYVPKASKWLAEQQWEYPPAAASQGREPDEDEIAAIRRMMDGEP